MKKIICIAIILYSLILPITAEDLSVYEKQYDALGIGDLERNSMSGDVEFSVDISLDEGIGGIWKKIRFSIRDIFSDGLSLATAFVIISFLSTSIATLFAENGEVVKRAVAFCASCAVCVLVTSRITGVMTMGDEFISSLEMFLKALIPTLAAAEALCGSPSAGVAKAGATILFSNILIHLIRNVFYPLVYMRIFVAAASSATENETLKKVSALISKIMKSTLKIFLGLYVSYITVSGIVSGSVDKFGVSATRLAAGSVPVVGGIIARASGTVLTGAGLLKNSVGIYATLVIASSFVTPFLTMAVNYILFRGASALSSPMLGGGISSLSDSVADSFGEVLALCASAALVSFISIIATMIGVGG